METREFIVGARQQREWGWLIILDFFAAGTGAGSFFIALILGFLPGMVLGGGLVLLGGLILIADLTRRQPAWRVFARPQSSWVSRGAIGISCLAVLAFIHIVYLAIQPNSRASLGAPWVTGPTWMIVLGIVSGVAALFVAAYPGFLLGSMRSIPFWKGAYTPALFLVSSLLSGLGIIYLFPSGWMALPWSLDFLQSFGIGLVVLGLFMLLSLFLVAHPDTTTGESVRLITHGSFRFHFLIGVLGVGLIVPLIILSLVSVGAGTVSLLPLAGVLLLCGLFLLRYIIVRGGIHVSPV
ncbi:NrfD/PsrC family molybdoenzyme membrane anchor subunit [Thermodesulfobacteriota bacterium]